MQNFADISSNFVKNGGAIQVKDAAELETRLAELLADPARRETLGKNAAKVVHENLGAIERTVDMIIEHLEGGQFYIAPRR